VSTREWVVSRLVAAGALAALACPSVSVAQDLPHLRGRKVVLLALPSSMAGNVIDDTQHLASQIAASLRTAGVRVVVAGVEAQVPLEELAGTANASGPAVTIGVRSLGSSGKCAAAITPQRVPKPFQPDGPLSKDEFGRVVKQLAASSRAEVSTTLAKVLASVVRCCPRKPTESERYVLDAINSPTVLLSLGSSDAAVFLSHVPALLERWIAMEQE